MLADNDELSEMKAEGMEIEHLDEDAEPEELEAGDSFVPVARNQCPHCFAQFALEKNFVEHMWSAHGSKRPFRCDDCGIFLSYRSSLYNHRKIHSDKRPFACTECSAKFRWNNSLKYHMTRAHQKSPPPNPTLKITRRRDLSTRTKSATITTAPITTQHRQRSPPLNSPPVSSQHQVVESVGGGGSPSLGAETGSEDTDEGLKWDASGAGSAQFQASSLVQLLMATAAAAAGGSSLGLNENSGSSGNENGIKSQKLSCGSSDKVSSPPLVRNKRKAIPRARGSLQRAIRNFEVKKCPGCPLVFNSASSMQCHVQKCTGAVADRIVQEVISKPTTTTGPNDQQHSPPKIIAQQPSLPEVSPPPSIVNGVEKSNPHSPALGGGGAARGVLSALDFLSGASSPPHRTDESARSKLDDLFVKKDRSKNELCQTQLSDAKLSKDVLAERLQRICSQQEAILGRLEGFELWVQQRVGKMESILGHLLTSQLFAAPNDQD